MPYQEALQAVSKCDIIMGKILPTIGWFGRFELEGMALGRPVVAYMSDALYEKRRPPVCRTTKDTLKQDLAALISDHWEQRRLSEAGLCYVTEKHDTPKVCQTLERCYDRL
jgi:hypothetical protein